jgi:hypothetical protein
MTAQDIGGTVKPGFERVAEAFKKNFASQGEVGASVCLTVGGRSSAGTTRSGSPRA